MVHRLSCSLACRDLIPQPGLKPTSPKHQDNIRWILSSWTSREVSELITSLESLGGLEGLRMPAALAEGCKAFHMVTMAG